MQADDEQKQLHATEAQILSHIENKLQQIKVQYLQ